MLATTALLAATPGRGAAAQDNDGALFLLVPVGARAIGMGQAMAAAQPGSEAVWWNPAGLARIEEPEAAIHHSQTFVATGDALSIVVPSERLGVLTASVNILDFGTQQITDPVTGEPFGDVTIRNIVYAATYATTIGSRINAGVSYKLVQFRFDCNPSCGDIKSVASTSALDAGAQYDMHGVVPVTLGVVLRNFGPRLQVKDEEQADDLPTRVQIGVRYELPSLEAYLQDTRVFVAGDVIDGVAFNEPAASIGTDIVWNDRIHVRGGYLFENSAAAGASLGFGLVLEDLVLDIARIFEDFSSSAGEAPTYLSLRVIF